MNMHNRHMMNNENILNLFSVSFHSLSFRTHTDIVLVTSIIGKMKIQSLSKIIFKFYSHIIHVHGLRESQNCYQFHSSRKAPCINNETILKKMQERPEC